MKQLTIITAKEARVFDLPEKFWVKPVADSTHVVYEGDEPLKGGAEYRYPKNKIFAKIGVSSSFVISEKEEQELTTEQALTSYPFNFFEIDKKELLTFLSVEENEKSFKYVFARRNGLNHVVFSDVKVEFQQSEEVYFNRIQELLV